MARIRAASNAITGTGTVSINSKVLGGYKLNADGTNLATLTIRDNDVSGKILYSTKTTVGEKVTEPVDLSNKQVYYDVSGTNADLQIFEWKDKNF